MHKLFIIIQFAALVVAGPSVVFDYKCTPTLACTIMTMALSQGGIGLSAVNDISIGKTLPLHKAVEATYSCPPKYCKDPSSSCMEYPFSSTKDKVPRKYRCVPSEELKMLDYMLTSAYTSGRITDGGSFYVGVSNIPDSGCV